MAILTFDKEITALCDRSGDFIRCGGECNPAELGYEVTMVKDATADYSEEEMHAALEVNIPNYASAIVTTNEVVASIADL